MWPFWIVTGLLAAAAAAAVIARAGAAAREASRSTEDPALAVYRRQLAELDLQMSEGLLGCDEHRTARAEAGRRLLRFADARGRREGVGGRASRLSAVLAVVLAAIVALGAYLHLGAPGSPDEPYAKRLASWRANPAALDPPRMAAVLREIVRARPHDPQAYDFLGRTELEAGDAFGAGRAFATAAALAPRRADIRTDEGEALVFAAGGTVTPQAEAAFRAALALDPKTQAARFYLARAAIARGDTLAGLAGWRALLADMTPNDPRRSALIAAIAHVGAGGDPGSAVQPPADQAAGAPGAAFGAQAVFIRSMVARQAAELKAHPDDPQGWARLIRSYGVLGDADARRDGLAQARRLFAGRPAALATIEAEAQPRPGGT